ncbi:hypothetical protein, partial [Streptomyces parvus]|uniref:hypothetical protein n=1 Tax=Streptomyces parvus TaxID=66428 RepID=UPI0033F32965
LEAQVGGGTGHRIDIEMGATVIEVKKAVPPAPTSPDPRPRRHSSPRTILSRPGCVRVPRPRARGIIDSAG